MTYERLIDPVPALAANSQDLAGDTLKHLAEHFDNACAERRLSRHDAARNDDALDGHPRRRHGLGHSECAQIVAMALLS